jgi:post-segregation antitoxin (ccd killing protein)
MRVKVSVTLSSDLVDEARSLGLNMSRIVETALIREVAAERLRRQADRAGDREGDGTGSSTTET